MTSPVGSVPLPPPSADPPLPDPGGGALDDAMADLYVGLSDLRQDDSSEGASIVSQDQAEADQARAAQAAALERARAEQADSGRGFFASIAHVVGDFVGDLAHGRIAAAFSDAGRDLGEAWNSPRFWGDIETALSDVSLVSTAVAGVSAALGPLGAPVAAVAGGVGAAAGAGAGLAKAREDDFAAAAEDADADATSAQDEIAELAASSKNTLAGLATADQAHQGALESLSQAMSIDDDTRAIPASIRVKG